MSCRHDPSRPVTRQLRCSLWRATGAADYKNRRQVEEFAPQEAWPARFEDFFANFDFRVQNSACPRLARTSLRLTSSGRFQPPDLWRINNDAVLFTELIFPQDDQRNAGFRTSVRTFVELIRAYDKKYESDGMSVRGCVWTAGFPLRNKTVRIATKRHRDHALRRGCARRRHSPPDEDLSAERRMPLVTPTNFIGRDMDLGYRLMDECPPGRIVTSLDAANLLTSVQDRVDPDLALWHGGWQWLPEILGGVKYPRLFVEPSRHTLDSHPWDARRVLQTTRPSSLCRPTPSH